MHLVEDDDSSPLSVRLQSTVIFIVQVERSCDEPMTRKISRKLAYAVQQALLMSLDERFADLIEAVINRSPNRSSPVRLSEIMAVCNSVYLYNLKE
jgi:hypothetical protein